MNRRSFMERLLGFVAGSTVAYSFPTIIVPQNIVLAETVPLVSLPTPAQVSMAQRVYIENFYRSYAHASDFFRMFESDVPMETNHLGRQILLSVG